MQPTHVYNVKHIVLTLLLLVWIVFFVFLHNFNVLDWLALLTAYIVLLLFF